MAFKKNSIVWMVIILALVLYGCGLEIEVNCIAKKGELDSKKELIIEDLYGTNEGGGNSIS